MGKKKKFIDKKKSATFQLLARDTSDPNYGDGASGDRVFIRVDNNAHYSVNSFFEDQSEDPNSIFADAPDDCVEEEDGLSGSGFLSSTPKKAAATLPDHIRKEILELGFPDDGYNYLLHLREIKNAGGGAAYYENPKAMLEQLPNDVKAYDASRLDISKSNDDSNERSIYNVAAKTVDVRVHKAIDSEMAALLDDSDLSRFGSDVEDLEEDFVIKANHAEEPVEIAIDKKLSLLENFQVNGNKTEDWDTSHPRQKLVPCDKENETRNTKDSREHCYNERPRVHRLLDEQFDLVELQEYGTDGEDEYDEYISEYYNHQESLAEKLNHAFKDHPIECTELGQKYKAPSDFLDDKKAEDAELLESASDVLRRCMEYAEKYENNSQDEAVDVVEESSDESEAWDCETIISTYSNLDNHPGRIGVPEARRRKKLAETVSVVLRASNDVISLKGKERLPVHFLPHSRNLTKEKADSVKSIEPPKRKQHGQESKKEKKERKAAVKQDRRDARASKKEMKGLYRCEAQRAQKVAAFTGPSSIHLM